MFGGNAVSLFARRDRHLRKRGYHTTYDKDNKATTKQFIPTDVKGNTVTPFIANNTTYLPVRAVANIFGATIDWNTFYSSVVIATAKNAVVTNTNPSAVDTSKVTAKYSNPNVVTGVNIYADNAQFIPTDANSKPVDVIMMNGTTYLPIRAMSNLFGATIDWDDANYTATIVGAKAATSGDTEELDDTDLSSIIKNLFGNLISKDKIVSMLSDILALRLKAEDAFGITDIKTVINKMIDNMSADQMIKLIKAWAEANNTTLDKLQDMFGVDNVTELIAKFKTALKGYVDGMQLPDLKAFLETIKTKLGIDFDLDEIFGKVEIDPSQFLAYIKKMLPGNIDIPTLLAKVQAKIDSGKTAIEALKAALGEMIPNLSDSKIKDLINGWLTQNPQYKLSDLLKAFGSSDINSLIANLKTKLGGLIGGSSSTGLQDFMDMISGLLNKNNGGSTGTGSSVTTQIDAEAISNMLKSVLGQLGGSFDIQKLITAIKDQFAGKGLLQILTSLNFDTVKDAVNGLLANGTDNSKILSAIKAWGSGNGFTLEDIQNYFKVGDSSSLISAVISAMQSGIKGSGTTDFLGTLNNLFGTNFKGLSDIIGSLKIG